MKDLTETKPPIFESTHVDHANVAQVGGDNYGNIYQNQIDEEFIKQFAVLAKEDQLHLEQLIKQKIDECKIYFYNFQKDKLKEIVDSFFKIGISTMTHDNQELLLYYRILVLILNKNSKLSQQYINNIDNTKFPELHLKCQNIYDLFNNQIDSLDNDLFNDIDEQNYLLLISYSYRNEHNKVIDIANKNNMISEGALRFKGAAYFNVGNSLEAKKCYESLTSLKNEEDTQFLLLIFSLAILIDPLNHNEEIDIQKVQIQFDLLVDFNQRYPEAKKGNEKVYFTWILQAILILDFKNFKKRFESLTKENNLGEEYERFLGVYYQENNEFVNAIDIFEKLLKSGDDGELYNRLLFCYFIEKQYSIVIDKYRTLNEQYKIVENMHLYMSSINELYPDEYDEEFKKIMTKFEITPKFLWSLSGTVKNSNSSFVKNELNILLDNKKEEIFDTDNTIKILLLKFICNLGDFTLCKEIIESLSNLNKEDKNLLNITVLDITNKEKQCKICNILYKNNIKLTNVLQVLIADCIDTDRITEALILLEEIFDMYPHQNTACHIINLLSRKEVEDIKEYKKYIDYLEGQPTLSSDASLQLALAYKNVREYNKSHFYLYKSIFTLNNEINPLIFEQFIGLFFLMSSYHKDEETDFKDVQDDTVVYLQNKSTQKIIHYCINHEHEFQTDKNTINAIHLSKNTPLYLQLKNKKINSIINIDQQNYTITSIIHKYAYTARYVMSHLSNDTSQFIKIITGSSDNPENFLKELLELLPDNSSEELLIQYHEIDKELGIPIEFLRRDYDKYMDIVNYLLFTNNELLYTGINTILYKKDHKFIISLSTLVVLCQLNNLSLLNCIKDHIIIPKSLIDFVQSRSINAGETAKVSKNSLYVNKDQKPFLLENQNYEDMWNDIYTSIYQVETIEIDNKERQLAFAYEDLSLTELFDKAELHYCQLDALILAKKYDAVYIADDLFLRRIARGLGIKEANSSLLLNFIDDCDEIEVLLTNYFNSNYIYPTYEGEFSHQLAHKVLKSDFKNEKKAELYGKKIFLNEIIN